MRFGLLRGRLALMCLGLATALVLVGGLAGCGATGGGSSNSTGGPPVDCGTVTVREGPNTVLNGDKAGPAEDCFWRAFQRCQVASLVVTAMGVDAGVTRTFTTVPQRGGGCGLSDKREHYVVPSGTSQAETFTCASLTQVTGGGLVAKGCGADGDITIPAPAASLVP